MSVWTSVEKIWVKHSESQGNLKVSCCWCCWCCLCSICSCMHMCRLQMFSLLFLPLSRQSRQWQGSWCSTINKRKMSHKAINKEPQWVPLALWVTATVHTTSPHPTPLHFITFHPTPPQLISSTQWLAYSLAIQLDLGAVPTTPVWSKYREEFPFLRSWQFGGGKQLLLIKGF